MDAGFEAHLRIGSDTFDGDDAALLRAIYDEGLLNAAESSLGRSYSGAQKRVTALESELGTVRSASPGGDDGGSRQPDEGRDVLAKFARLKAALEDTVLVEEVTIPWTVVAHDGKLATVETAAGTIQALASGPGPAVHVVLRVDGVTLHSRASAPPSGGPARATGSRGRLTMCSTGRRLAVSSLTLTGCSRCRC
ncbi:winged helix-turn-helix domain-containing protein [Haloarcula sp. JP-L23]|uniref:winged helix-turn-helix domain-containing protein n=1 Tax=Haloarcula sp. JP-L23 TaxID=2716717 RepID=UPI001D043FCC